MCFRIAKIIFILLLIIGTALTCIFVIYPRALIKIYRGDDEKTIWVEMKYLPVKKLISDTDNYKFYDLQWSPNDKYLAFYDFVGLETFNREWGLKIVNVRNFKIKTIFIGDYKTGQYKWIDNRTVRVYEGAGSGVRIYRDIDINIAAPFIAAEHMSPEYWTPEKTF